MRFGLSRIKSHLDRDIRVARSVVLDFQYKPWDLDNGIDDNSHIICASVHMSIGDDVLNLIARSRRFEMGNQIPDNDENCDNSKDSGNDAEGQLVIVQYIQDLHSKRNLFALFER
eukprot:516339_1